MNDQFQQLMSNAPAWAREPAVLIGAAAIAALLLLWLLSRLFRRRPAENPEAPPLRVEEELPVARPITPPPVAPFAPQAEAPPPAEPPVIEAATPQLAPEPIAAPPAPVLPEAAEPAPPPPPTPVFDEAPEPAPLADEPIVAAAPFDASPASIAADVPETRPQPAPEPIPAPMAGPDDLTRMKGVGPRLAARLNSVGVNSFAQIAALTPADAEALDAQLGDFQGRIHRDRWIEQAAFLAENDLAGFEGVFGKL